MSIFVVLSWSRRNLVKAIWVMPNANESYLDQGDPFFSSYLYHVEIF